MINNTKKRCDKYCDWNIGAGISGKDKRGNDIEIGIFLCCKKCGRIVEAHYQRSNNG